MILLARRRKQSVKSAFESLFSLLRDPKQRRTPWAPTAFLALPLLLLTGQALLLRVLRLHADVDYCTLRRDGSQEVCR